MNFEIWTILKVCGIIAAAYYDKSQHSELSGKKNTLKWRKKKPDKLQKYEIFSNCKETFTIFQFFEIWFSIWNMDDRICSIFTFRKRSDYNLTLKTL
jgi:hypothetical protein